MTSVGSVPPIAQNVNQPASTNTAKATKSQSQTTKDSNASLADILDLSSQAKEAYGIK